METRADRSYFFLIFELFGTGFPLYRPARCAILCSLNMTAEGGVGLTAAGKQWEAFRQRVFKMVSVGVVDDPRCFAYPERIRAGVLWFTRGYIEYIIPNLLPAGTRMEEITLSMEISSEAPGVNSDWPSDISFYLNDTKLGIWTSPGDYGDIPGIFTPSWWFPNWNQYGLLKMLVINRKGTFIDGLKISDVSIDQFRLDYKSTFRFKFRVEDNAKNIGGLTLFGKGFGNYNQDIKVRMTYRPGAEQENT